MLSSVLKFHSHHLKLLKFFKKFRIESNIYRDFLFFGNFRTICRIIYTTFRAESIPWLHTRKNKATLNLVKKVFM